MAKNPLESQFWKVDDKIFKKKLRVLLKRAGDVSPAFKTIGDMFRQSRKTIFDLGSPGGYPDFKTEASARQKEREVKFRYPLLLRHGQLEESITNIHHPNNINIINKKAFAFGTSMPYAKYHNSSKRPRNKIPQRKFIFWGAEARKFQNLTGETRTFQGRALKILKDYLSRDMD